MENITLKEYYDKISQKHNKFELCYYNKIKKLMDQGEKSMRVKCDKYYVYDKPTDNCLELDSGWINFNDDKSIKLIEFAKEQGLYVDLRFDYIKKHDYDEITKIKHAYIFISWDY
ncbi:hypothetical protein H012_gp023 [Acanthamoeba polyphaga moumouvirus]|uniref:Uncharacterized protein n=1 Tax=Acanthamoeba polyphaga moumouvirus TaxID=1269028 RepID=L7RGZ5_9VIRU|nr:hypothetical protein H012_gp023 [Acanthamoeba polyphaga moumouvirus]AGC02425.1 hypothetical protein Moumou_00910 [Acanthamoeba polyphaga moumouvirus]